MISGSLGHQSVRKKFTGVTSVETDGILSTVCYLVFVMSKPPALKGSVVSPSFNVLWVEGQKSGIYRFCNGGCKANRPEDGRVALSSTTWLCAQC
ncbi:hypothetical protein MCEMSHM24_02446 [Comamonadaceae bacterium]